MPAARGLAPRSCHARDLSALIGLLAVIEGELDPATGDAATDDRTERLFKEDMINDILLLVSFTGTSPPGPA
jgi:hypothetical protein